MTKPIKTPGDYAEAMENENVGLLVRIDAQERVIRDLRQELENACRRIVDIERGDAEFSSAAKAMADAIHYYLAQSWVGPVTVDAIRAAKDEFRRLERGRVGDGA